MPKVLATQKVAAKGMAIPSSGWLARRRELKKARSSCLHQKGTVIRVYDAVGNVIETHQHTGEFREFLSENLLSEA
jgi:hypothetical protein